MELGQTKAVEAEAAEELGLWVLQRLGIRKALVATLQCKVRHKATLLVDAAGKAG